jgi:hypothetical protein
MGVFLRARYPCSRHDSCTPGKESESEQRGGERERERVEG